MPYCGKSALANAAPSAITKDPLTGKDTVMLPCLGVNYSTVKGHIWAIVAFEKARGITSNATTNGVIEAKMKALRTGYKAQGLPSFDVLEEVPRVRAALFAERWETRWNPFKQGTHRAMMWWGFGCMLDPFEYVLNP